MFIAVLVPGALLATGFVLWILLTAKFAPGIVFASPKARQATPERTAHDELSTGQLVRKIIPIIPIIVLVAFVLGGLYSGFFTPTEAGGVGAFGPVGFLFVYVVLLLLGMILDSSSILLIVVPIAAPIALRPALRADGALGQHLECRQGYV